MKTKLIALLLLIAFNFSFAQLKPNQAWLDQKFSMFIHFGLYSEYGGVYNGKPVESGYSEQIQSFAGIFSDWYANTAKQFNPIKWNADSIVSLAKDAGMKSIVFTSKHHDGFCLFHSKHTQFNIVDATPYKKDLMRELAEACQRGGIDFAVYFSLIDWSYPQAYPISSHNADPITPEHHQFNMQQVEEIMSNYGAISEIWFDMGSLSLQQSKELYNLVNQLQPHCMISGRLGNDFVDFSVMADNEYPNYKMGHPWQTAASMFNETWGYRSWQQRGNVEDKTKEKIKSLIQVASHGGNYLLNIGPRGDGSVVEFEKEVLLNIGEWLSVNEKAIYASKANPLPYYDDKYGVTARENKLYIFPFESVGEITLKQIDGKIRSVKILGHSDKELPYSQNHKNKTISFQIDNDKLPQNLIFPVVEIEFENGYHTSPNFLLEKNKILYANNATPTFAHSSLDYYCGYKSLTSYTWNFNSEKSEKKAKIYFTDLEKNRNIVLKLNGIEKRIKLDPTESKLKKLDQKNIKWGKLYMQRGRGVFGNLPYENDSFISNNNVTQKTGYQDIVNRNVDLKSNEWLELNDFPYGCKLELELNQRGSILILQELIAKKDMEIALEVGSGNGMYLLLNGNYITAHCLTHRPSYQKEIVVLQLKKGVNQIVIKYFNRFEESLQFSITPLDEWVEYSTESAIPSGAKGINTLQVFDADATSKVAPLRMNNIRISIK